MQSINRNRPSSNINLQAELSRLIADRQQQISTGRRIDKPSEDPAAWSQISDIAKVQANMDVWLQNIDRGRSIASQAETAIAALSTQLARANELLIQASNGAISTENREVIAQEVDGIRSSVNELLFQNNAFGKPLFSIDDPIKFPIDENLQATMAPGSMEFSALDLIITDVAEAIRNGGDADRSNMLDRLQLEITDVANILGRQGVALNRLEQVQSNLEDRQLDITEYRSSLEDADITRSIADMQKLLINLEAAQATYARIEKSSLFDLIR